MMDLIIHGLEARKNGPKGESFSDVVNGSVEDNSQMATDPRKDLGNPLSTVHASELVVEGSNDGGDRGRSGRIGRKANGHGIGTDAFNKAGRMFPGLWWIRNGGRGGPKVGVSDHLEQHVLGSPRELSGHTLMAYNGVLDVFRGGSTSCLFWNSWLEWRWRGSHGCVGGGRLLLPKTCEVLEAGSSRRKQVEEAVALLLVLS
jgi:hypothetical protein